MKRNSNFEKIAIIGESGISIYMWETQILKKIAIIGESGIRVTCVIILFFQFFYRCKVYSGRWLEREI